MIGVHYWYMIPRSRKFPLRTEFLRFRSRAKRITTPHLTFFYLQHTQSGVSEGVGRLGVIIPKKVSKLATTRNYLKRFTYNTLWPRVKDQQKDVVVVYKPLPIKKSSQIQTELINELTQSAGNL